MRRATAGGETIAEGTEERGRAARPAGTLRQAAYDRIEDLLNEGRLRPGEMISQRELVDATGATLGAVREAIPKLEAEGLLQTLPKRGLMVPSLDVGFVRDAYQMRAMIELAAVPFAMREIPAATLEGWIGAHERARDQLAAGEDGDLPEYIQRMDWRMHAALVAAMDNALIANSYRVTAIKIRMAVQSRIRVTPSNGSRVVAEHLGFLVPLARGDAAAAAAALSRHIDNSLTLALGGRLDPPGS